MTKSYINILKEINREIPPDIAARFKDDALFIAYGCILLEHKAGRSYSYKAVNLETGCSAPIIRRVNPLTISGVAAMIEKIKTSPVAGAGHFNTDMRTGNNLFHDRLAEIMDYIFMELLPTHGYGVRETQIELAKHILDALVRRNLSLAEAEVGTGKTLAYLTAATLAKRGRVNDFWLRGSYPAQSYAASAFMPVVLSTSSIALQNAVVKGYIPDLSRILMEHEIIRRPLTCVVRKGKEHYVCEKNLLTYYKDADERTKQVLAPLLTSRSVDLAGMDDLTVYVKRRICVSGRCGGDCQYYKPCRYQRYMKRAQSGEYDFQVCNHNYFLADLLRRTKDQPPLIPHYQAVIIDEAHKFLEAARQMYGVRLDSGMIPRIAEDALSFTYRQGENRTEIDALTKKVANQSRRLFTLLDNTIPQEDLDDDAERFKTVMNSKTSRCLRNIRRIAGELTAALLDSKPLRRHEGRCSQACWELGNIMKQAAVLQDYEELVYWLEKPVGHRKAGSGETYLCAIPKRLNEMLCCDLWSRGIPIILTSGTLSASGDFTHTKRTLGIDLLPLYRVMETSKPSPFNHRENALLYISEAVPFPDTRDKRYIAAVAEEAERLIRASHGHAAVLFTSYKAMDMVYEILERRGLGFPLFRLDRGGTTAIDRFRKSKNGVLFASGAMWEGIDLPGDILSLLIIVKLPFAVPDPIGEYEQTLYKDMSEYKNSVVVPEMIIKLKQGFGRLIRHEKDTGIVALLDSRVREDGAYRDRVLRALPDCRVTSSIEDIKAFIQSKKGPDYFVYSGPLLFGKERGYAGNDAGTDEKRGYTHR